MGFESKMGNSLTMPRADATAEERQLFDEKVLKLSDNLISLDNKDDLLTKLGKPADKEGYKADPDKEYTIDLESAKDQALALGLTQEQYYNMVNNAQDKVNSQGETNKADHNAAMDGLYEEWGAAKPDKLKAIEGALELFKAPEAMKEQFKAGNLNSDLVSMLSRMAEGISGEKITAANDRSQGRAVVTPGEAEDLVTKYSTA